MSTRSAPLTATLAFVVACAAGSGAARTGTAAAPPNVRSVPVQMPTLEERRQMYYRYLAIPDRIQGLDLVEPHWMADGNSFWYAEGAPANTVIYKVDPVANTKAELFDRERLRAALTTVLGQAAPGQGLPFDRFSFVDETEEKVQFALEGNEYILDLADYSITRSQQGRSGLARSPGEGRRGGRWYHSVGVGPYFTGRIDEVPSPDGQWLLAVDGYDVELRSARDGTPRRLTTDGTSDYRWHIFHPDAVEWDGPPPLGHWSPDGRHLALWRIDSRSVPRNPVVHWNQPFGHPLHDEHRVTWVPEVDWLPAAPPRVELYIGELQGEGVRWVKVDPGPEPNRFIGGVRWRSDGSELFFHTEDPWGKRLDLQAAEPRTGRSRIVLTETAETFLDWQANARYDLLTFVEGGKRFIWRSNRDGWYDLYLYDIDGTLVRRLTEGPFEVTWPHTVDEGAGWIYFGVYGVGNRPYDMYLHRVRLDGSGFERLAERNGLPGPNGFSPSRQFFLLYGSTPSQPELVELRRVDGMLLQTLARENIGWLVENLHWSPPEEFVVKAADGKTDLQGLLFKPWDFDPKKKYPVVQAVYGNPSYAFHAWCTCFGSDFRDAPALAQLGFITFVVEERGTHGRGRAFRDVVYRNVGRHQIEDDVATLRQLAAERPYMDLTRVGIIGGSYGGYATVRAMLLAPEVYHVGVARSAKWMKWQPQLYGAPQRKIPDAYAYASNLTFAGNLKGKLLLAQATNDDLDATMIMIEALTDAGTPYDLIILPKGGHSLTERHPTYFHDARIRYLVEHLKPELGPEN